MTALRRVLLAAPLVLSACGDSRDARTADAVEQDAAYADMQTRGQLVMGVDQYASAHVFEDLPDGGRILLDRADARDTGDIAAIRRHMRDVAAAFRAGDFSKPFQVHAQPVPGSAVMAALRAAISYEALDRPRGAEVRIRTSDSTAVRAIHTFLGFQRSAHHAGGHDSSSRSTP